MTSSFPVGFWTFPDTFKTFVTVSELLEYFHMISYDKTVGIFPDDLKLSSRTVS